MRELVKLLGPPCRFLTATEAFDSITQPVVKEVNSVAVPMQLTLGERPDDPDDPAYLTKLERSIAMRVVVKKAVVAAAVKSMKKMSLKGFARREARREAYSQSQRVMAAESQRAEGGPPPEGLQLREAEKAGLLDRRQLKQLRDDMPDDFEAFAAQIFEDRRELLAQEGYDTDALLSYYLASGRIKRETGSDLGHLGKSLHALLNDAGLAEHDEEDLDPHSVVAEPRYFYKPTNAAKAEGEQSEDEDDDGSLRPADGSNLTTAYHYGGDIVDVGGMEGGTGILSGLQTGIEICGFMKKKVVGCA